jgi:hypothetical protein
MQNTHLTSQLVRLAILLSLWLAPLAWGQNVPVARLTPTHPLLQAMQGWWLVQPRFFGGATWWNIFPRYHLALSSMGTGSGWSPTSRAGWPGEIRFDGTDDAVFGPTDAVFDGPNATFSVMVRFRTTATAVQQWLVAKRNTTINGGWLLRVDGASTASLSARINGAAGGNAAARTTVSTTNGDGAWHTLLVVFTTDTVGSPGTNTITMYRDGVLDQGALTSTPDTYAACPSCRLSLSGSDDGLNRFVGAMDDVRFWSRAISATEALALHQQTPPTFGGMVTTPPVALSVPTVSAPRHIVIE